MDRAAPLFGVFQPWNGRRFHERELPTATVLPTECDRATFGGAGRIQVTLWHVGIHDGEPLFNGTSVGVTGDDFPDDAVSCR